MLSKTESPGVVNIETDVQRYNQTSSEFSLRNINGHAMLPDSTVYNHQTVTAETAQQLGIPVVL